MMLLLSPRKIQFLSVLLFTLTFASVLLPLQPTTQPVPAKEIFRYVPIQSNLVVQVDLKSMSRHFLQATKMVEKQPFVDQVTVIKDVHHIVKQAIFGSLHRWESGIGFSLRKDVTFLTASWDFRSLGKPALLLAFGGAFSAKQSDAMAVFLNVYKYKKKMGRFVTYLSPMDRDPSVALTPEGYLLFGSLQAVKEMAARPSTFAYPADALATKMLQEHQKGHFASVGLQPSKSHKDLLARVKLPAFKDLALATTAIHLSLESKKADLSAWVSDPAIRKRYHSFFEGMGNLGVAGGYLKLAALHFAKATFNPNNPHLPPTLKALAKHKKAMFAYLTRYLGISPMKFQTTAVGDKLRLHVKGGSSVALLLGMGGAAMIFPARAVMFATPPKPPVDAAPLPATQPSTKPAQ